MLKLTKADIMPVVSSICLLLQVVFHKSISQEMQDMISSILVNLFFLGFTIYGVAKKSDPASQLPEKKKENRLESTPSQNSDNSKPAVG